MNSLKKITASGFAAVLIALASPLGGGFFGTDTGRYSVAQAAVGSTKTMVGRVEFEYYVLDNGTAAVSGAKHYGVWTVEPDDDYTLDIPSEIDGHTVTTLNFGAARDCYEGHYNRVNIPDTVTTIGESAFHMFFSLMEINIPDSVTSIGADAFSGTALRTVTIGKGITEIPYDAFSFCRDIQTVTLPETVTSIGYHAFDLSSRIENIYYGGSEAQWNNIKISQGNPCFESPKLFPRLTVHYLCDHEHRYDQTEYTWSEDLMTCTAVRKCICGDSDINETAASSVNKLEPTYFEKGKLTYTASFANSELEKQERTEELEMKTLASASALRIAAKSRKSITLKWGKVDSATGYEI